jgi:hypothetical protein
MFVFLPVPLNLDIKCFAVNLSNCWGATDGLPTLLTVLVGLLETSYLDSKPVYMLSTKHGSSLSTTSRRNRITNEIIRKTNVVTNYNKYMGGVSI